ncbi:hypothetical protein SAMD00019534_040050, partial [Acytostelium subglobosum LB1]|uniref:hypothetical protein n=1 Tax=Acytostelium subglobosum LB1 TaxID=1410327 RepID=UPI000644FEE3
LNPGVLPDTLTSLHFVKTFKHKINRDTLPSSLTELQFGDAFNHELLPGTLPLGLTTLVFGAKYDCPLSRGTLPSTITSLTFGKCFEQVIEQGMLPESLLTLSLGQLFINTLQPGTLPSSLTSLTFFQTLSQDMPIHYTLQVDQLPQSLHTLNLPTWHSQLVREWFPPTLKRLTFEGFKSTLVTAELPQKLESLVIMYESYDYYLSPQYLAIIGQLPDTIVELKIDYCFRITSGVFPPSLTSLYLAGGRSQDFPPSFLPRTLTSLYLGDILNQPRYLIKGGWPSSLKRFSIGYVVSVVNPLLVPNGLTHLEAAKIDYVMSASIERVILKGEYDYKSYVYQPLFPLKSFSMNARVIRYSNARTNRQAEFIRKSVLGTPNVDDYHYKIQYGKSTDLDKVFTTHVRRMDDNHVICIINLKNTINFQIISL